MKTPKPTNDLDDMWQRAAEILKRAGFEFRAASSNSEATYFALPGRPELLRVAAHARGRGPDTIASITFHPSHSTPRGMRMGDAKFTEYVARGIGFYILNLDPPIEAQRGTFVDRIAKLADGSRTVAEIASEAGTTAHYASAAISRLRANGTEVKTKNPVVRLDDRLLIRASKLIARGSNITAALVAVGIAPNGNKVTNPMRRRLTAICEQNGIPVLDGRRRPT